MHLIVWRQHTSHLNSYPTPLVAKHEAGLHSQEVWVNSMADFFQHNKKTKFNLKTWSYHTSKN